jgi:hypothetical protein
MFYRILLRLVLKSQSVKIHNLQMLPLARLSRLNGKPVLR